MRLSHRACRGGNFAAATFGRTAGCRRRTKRKCRPDRKVRGQSEGPRRRTTMRAFDVATSFLASIARAGSGMEVAGTGARPEKMLELYEFEGCPFCRKVREALSILDLDAMIYPCPQNGPRFRKYVFEHAGKTQFPYFIDPNSGR